MREEGGNLRDAALREPSIPRVFLIPHPPSLIPIGDPHHTQKRLGAPFISALGQRLQCARQPARRQRIVDAHQ
jgi:hypothetical protein